MQAQIVLARLVVCLRCQQPQTLAGPVGNTMDCRSGHANPMTEAFLQTAGVFSQLELAVIRARVRSGMANASDNARMRQILQRTKTRKALVCKENPQSILFPFIGTQTVTPVEREWREPLPLVLRYAGNGITSLSGGRIFGCCSSGCMALSTRPISR